MPLQAALHEADRDDRTLLPERQPQVNPDDPDFKEHLLSREVEAHVVDFILCEGEYTDREDPATTVRIHDKVSNIKVDLSNGHFGILSSIRIQLTALRTSHPEQVLLTRPDKRMRGIIINHLRASKQFYTHVTTNTSCKQPQKLPTRRSSKCSLHAKRLFN